jgi:hypothetical protein
MSLREAVLLLEDRELFSRTRLYPSGIFNFPVGKLSGTAKKGVFPRGKPGIPP